MGKDSLCLHSLEKHFTCKECAGESQRKKGYICIRVVLKKRKADEKIRPKSNLFRGGKVLPLNGVFFFCERALCDECGDDDEDDDVTVILGLKRVKGSIVSDDRRCCINFGTVTVQQRKHLNQFFTLLFKQRIVKNCCL